MTNTILLILWLTMPAQELPTFQVLSVAGTMKECNVVREQLVKKVPEVKQKLACMQILSSLKDAGASF